MYYGYYIPNQDIFCGDQELAQESYTIYMSFGIDKKHAGRYDGVSIIIRDNVRVARVAMQDFFSETFRVKVHDL